MGRRLRVVPFEIKFVENPVQENERKIDKTLKQKLETWTQAFISILLERFQIYKKNKYKINEPDKVTGFTKEYQRRSDKTLEFLREIVITTSNVEDTLTFNDIWREFKAWFKESQTEGKSPSRNEFKSEVYEKLGKPKNSVWTRKIFKLDQQQKTDDFEDNEDHEKK